MTVYLFSSFEYYLEEKMLLYRGNQVQIRQKTARLLEIFLEKPNRLFRKDELISMIWGEEQQKENVLIQTAYDLRKALAGFTSIRFFSNIKGVGYIWNYEFVVDLPFLYMDGPHFEDDSLFKVTAYFRDAPHYKIAPHFKDGLLDKNGSGNTRDPKSMIKEGLPDHRNIKSAPRPEPHLGTPGQLLVIFSSTLALTLITLITLSLISIKQKYLRQSALSTLPPKQLIQYSDLEWVKWGITDILADRFSRDYGLKYGLDPFLKSAFDPLASKQQLREGITLEIRTWNGYYITTCALYNEHQKVVHENIFIDVDLSVCLEELMVDLTIQYTGTPPNKKNPMPKDLQAALNYGKAMQAKISGDPESALHLIRTIERPTSKIIPLLLTHAKLLASVGKMAESDALLKEARNNAKNYNHRPYIRLCLEALAENAQKQGRTKQALSYGKRALLFSEGHHQSALIGKINLFELYVRNNLLEEAKSLKLEFDTSLLNGSDYQLNYLAKYLYALGRIALMEEQWATANLLFREAHIFYQNINNHSGLEACQDQLLLLSLREKNYPQVENLIQAIISFNKVFLPNDLENLLDLGETLMAHKQIEFARLSFEIAIQETNETPNPAKRLRLYYRLAEVYLATGEPDLGHPYLKICFNWIQSQSVKAESQPWFEIDKLQKNYRDKGYDT